MSEHNYDIIVIGGGIVGLATAMAICKQAKTLVIEAEERLAMHQTGNNSGVIHSGLYYKPGSLKAGNCVKGRQALYAFCKEHGIAHDQCGKVVVATREDELPALEELYRRGSENGLTGLKKITPDEIRDIEPHVRGIAGLYVPQTGIVDFVQVCERFADEVRKQKGDIQTNTRFLGVEKRNSELVLNTSRGKITAKYLINCGGLYSDRIAKKCGVDPGLQIIPFRGEYYEIKKDFEGLVKNLIYPVPDPRFPFLGVHFTRMIHGGIEAGPNAVLAFKREGYKKLSFSIRDVVEYMTYIGFWKMAMKYWKMSVGEYYRSFSKRAFVRALQRLIPEIDRHAVTPGGAGVRAQALEPDGKLVDDFRIVQAEQMIHVLNAPSPAATAAISIGEAIAEKACSAFEL